MYNPKLLGKRSFLIGIDPGVKPALACSNGLHITTKEIRSHCHYSHQTTQRNNMYRNKKIPGSDLSVAEWFRDTPKSETSSLDEYKTYLCYIIPQLEFMEKFHLTSRTRRDRFTRYVVGQKAYAALAKVIAMGTKVSPGVVHYPNSPDGKSISIVV